MNANSNYDIIIAGSGMGGMSAGAMLSSAGFKVLILEAAHAPGGCSSSFYRKGYWFETGATTLTGFDKHQPLWKLEKETGIKIPRIELQPSMAVHLGGYCLFRHHSLEQWIEEISGVFGQKSEQRSFWKLAKNVADIVWKASLDNPRFPPQKVSEWLELLTNNQLADAWVLPYAFKSVKTVMSNFGTTNPDFSRFVDEQLMITAQSKAVDTPFLFGAPALTYTNYSNYYVPGGLLTMVDTIRDYIDRRGGALYTKEAVRKIVQKGDSYAVFTQKKKYQARVVVSNIPVWNLPELTVGTMKQYFQKESRRFDKAWGAVTLGMVTKDTYPDGLPLHHQIHLDKNEKVSSVESDSIFVSLSHPNDEKRNRNGNRVLNISCHTRPEPWFSKGKGYDSEKRKIEQHIIRILDKKMPGFGKDEIINVFSGTPVTWQNWVYRKKGRVGGIPQSMARSLLDWTPASPPFKNLYMCGDTVFPGQGIPGVTLSGINVYHRVKENFN